MRFGSIEFAMLIAAIVSMFSIAMIVMISVSQPPCLEYGPRRLLYMQPVGGSLIPIYGRDCLLRSATP